MATESSTDFTLDSAAALAAEEQGAIEGKSPWLLAWRRLRRNYVALAFLGLFVVIVVLCLLAPVYKNQIAHTGPNTGHLGETFTRDGKQVEIVSKGGFVGTQFHAGGIPVGPQLWHAGGKYVFGADNQGRDVAVRLLYGGLNSMKIGIGSALICTFFAVVLALLAGYYGGWVDWIIARFFDLIWAFPVILLAIALGTALSINDRWAKVDSDLMVKYATSVPYMNRSSTDFFGKDMDMSCYTFSVVLYWDFGLGCKK